jgi:hypothetical protein
MSSSTWKSLARAFPPEFDAAQQRDVGLQLLLVLPGMRPKNGLLSHPLKVKAGAKGRSSVTARSQHYNKPSRVAHLPVRAPLALT